MTALTKINNPEEAIRRAIIELQQPQPFFAHLLMHMNPRMMPEEWPNQSMAVDQNGTLYFSHDWVMKQTRETMRGVLCHEVLHVAFLHLLRTGNRIPEIANIAQDVTVNMMVSQAHLQLPEDGLAKYNRYRDESSFQLLNTPITISDVTDKTWEEVYAEIIDQLKQNGKDPNDVQGRQGWDGHIKSEGLTGKEKNKVRQKWTGKLTEAAQYAKQQGSLPAGMQRYVDDLLKPKVQWKQYLLKYLRPYVTPVDWSYRRPHKKSGVLGVYLPNTLRESCEVEVLVDTSGSIGKKELTEFLSEIVAIANAMNHVTMHVNFCDHQVEARYEVSNGDIPKIMAMEPKGGGGTSMENGLDYITEKNSRTPVVVVLTDGYTSFNKTAKDYAFDVLWVINKNGMTKERAQNHIPYGTIIKMD